MAAQKAEAQKRLLRPSKKFDGDDGQKRRVSVEKKKEELVSGSYQYFRFLQHQVAHFSGVDISKTL